MQTLMMITTGELQHSLYGARYPMSKQHIMRFVKERRASFGLQKELKQLPDGIYFGVLDIQEEIMQRVRDEEEN